MRILSRMFLTLIAAALLNAAAVAQDPGVTAPAPVRIIVNATNPVTSMTRSRIAKLFLKKTTKWDDGSKVLPVDQDQESPVRSDFSDVILNKSIAQVSSYWQQQIFSGRSMPPPVLVSDQAVAEFVKSNAGAIGYVSVSFEINDMKVLIVDE